MKKFIYLLLLLFVCMGGLSAQNHFIYIQSQSKEPFTVNLNNKNYSSTATGYVIIPKLASGEYSLAVQFPKAANASNKFDVLIEKKDVGFSLVSSPDASLALTNIQSFVTLRAGEKAIYASANNIKQPDNNPVAKVDNRPVAKVESKPETVTKPVNNPPVKTPVKKAAPETQSVASNAKLQKGVNKVYEMQGEQIVSLLYIDVQDKGNDTIDIVIPVSNTQRKAVNNRSAVKNNSTNFVPVETKNIESGLSLVAVNQDGYNTNCVNLASGDDFFRLRKKMASESNDDKMISELKKAAKNKCFTTIQVKNLASLFMTDEGKYKFFNASYPLVYDIIQFPTLEKELNEPAYIEKFRAIMHK